MRRQYVTKIVKRRRLRCELLEPRLLLANDFPFQNAGQRFDVNRDLKITALDALQAINFLGQNGPDFVLPAINGGVHFPDVNGSNSVTSLDALQIINRLPPELDSILAARLSMDSAPGGESNLDFITNNYGLEFGVTRGSGSDQIELRIDGAESDPFVALSATVDDDLLAVSEAEIEAIAGGPLADGDHRFEVRIVGQTNIEEFVITVDNTPPAAPDELLIEAASDSGIVGDNVTNETTPRLVVPAETGELVSLIFNEQMVDSQVAQSPVEFSLGPIADGDYRVQATVEDVAGNLAQVFTLLRIDTVAPVVTNSIGDVLTESSASLTFALDSFAGSAALDPSSYLLEVAGGPSDGQQIDIVAVDASIPQIAKLSIDQPLPDGSYQLTYKGVIDDVAGNTVGSDQAVQFDVIDPATIRRYAPRDGEQLASLTREVVVEFDQPIDPATVTPDAIQVIAAGERIDGTMRVSRSEQAVTFFHDEPFPASARVRIMVDGDQIIGRDGLAVDGDGDGSPGGDGIAEFTTLSLTQIPGTSVFGFLLDSNRVDAGGVPIPISGATIAVEGLPQVSTTTDATGFFELTDVPAPEFYVEVDAQNSLAPDGFSYGKIRKPLHSEIGQRIQLTMDGETFDMFLPLIPESDQTPLSNSESTSAGFGPDALARLAEITPQIPAAVWSDLRVDIEPGTLLFDDGTPADSVAVIPLDPEKIPAPLPTGVDPTIVFTVDAGGAQNVDGRATLTIPNVENLAPGERRFILSFDHDAGEWITTGALTVSPDGSILVSDDDAGVKTLGWRTQKDEPGTEQLARAKQIDVKAELPPDPFDDARDASEFAILLDASGNLFELGLSVAGRVVLPQASLITNSAALAADLNAVKQSDDGISLAEAASLTFDVVGLGAAAVGTGIIFSVGAIPTTGAAATWFAGTVAVGAVASVGGLLADVLAFNELEDAGSGDQLIVIHEGEGENLPCARLDNASANENFQMISTCISQAGEEAQRFQDSQSMFNQSIGRILSLLFDPGLANRYSRFNDEVLQAEFDVEGNGIGLLDVDGQRVLADDGRASIPAQELIQDADLVALGNELSFIAPDALVAGARGLFAEGAGTLGRLKEAATIGAESLSNLTEQTTIPAREAFYKITSGSFVTRGKASASGQLNEIIPFEQEFTVAFYDPATGLASQRTTRSGPSGVTQSLVAPLILSAPDPTDTDGDGLVDFAEDILGTALDRPDTDGDGVSDSAEVQFGRDPLTAIGFPTGQIASLPLKGEAVELTSEGSAFEPTGKTTFVATTKGLSIVDTSQLTMPILLDEIPLTGSISDVAANVDVGIAAVAAGGSGIHLVDVSDPLAATAFKRVSEFGPANRVEMFGDLLFAGGDTLGVIDPITGVVLQRVDLQRPITDMARDGGLLVVSTDNDRLHTIDVSSGTAVPLGSVSVPDGAFRVFIGGGVAFVSNGKATDLEGRSIEASLGLGGYSTVDVSDPDSPVVISGVDTPDVASGNVKTIANGSGLVVTAGLKRGLDLFDASDNEDTFDFLRQLDTSGNASSVIISAGVALVADGRSGLSVVNYSDFDIGQVPPTVSVVTSDIDLDTQTPGIQVIEGTIIPVTTTTSDDVQVRNVELLVNGSVVANDVSFPFEFAAIVPRISDGDGTARIQVRATDTGGNRSSSNAVVLDLLADTVDPEIVTVQSLVSTRRGPPVIDIGVSEPLDRDFVIPSSFQLVDGSGTSILATSVSFVGSARAGALRVRFPALPAADYELRINEARLRDHSGNAVGSGIDVRPISLVEATAIWIRPEGGDYDTPENWDIDRVPGPDDDALVVLNPGAEIIVSSIVDPTRSLTVEGVIRITGGSFSPTVLDITEADLTIDASDVGGSALRDTVVTRQPGSDNNSPVQVFGGRVRKVVFDVPVVVADQATLTVNNSLIVNDTLTLSAETGNSALRFADPVFKSMLGGVGRVVFGGTPTVSINNVVSANALIIGENLTIGPGTGTIFGSEIDLKGQLKPGPGEAIDISGLVPSDGTLHLAPNGGRILVGGTLADTTVTGEPGAVFETASLGATLDNVTLNLPAIVRDGQLVRMQDSTLTDTLTLDGGQGGATLSLENTSLAGQGELVFAGDLQAGPINRISFGQIGPEITIRGGIGTIDQADVLGLLKPDPGGEFTIGDITASSGVLNLDAPNGGLLFRESLADLAIEGTPGTVFSFDRSGKRLDNVTLNLPMVLHDGQSVSIDNGLTLNDTLTLASEGSMTTLEIVGDQTVLGGTGRVVFGGTPDSDSDNVLQTRGAGGVASALIEIGPEITVGHGRGTVRGTFGGVFNLKGRLDPGPGGRVVVKDITDTDGELNLDAPDGGLLFATRLTDLSIVGTPGTQFEVDRSFTTLDNVTLNVPAVIGPGDRLMIENGLTLNETLTLVSDGTSGSARAQLSFTGTQTVGGIGAILFGGTPQDNDDNGVSVSGSGAVLTIGADITIGGSRGRLQGASIGSMINVLGTLRADVGSIMDLRRVDLSEATLIIQIAGTNEGEFGRVIGTQSTLFELPETLVIERPTSFVPTAGDTFDILSISGADLTGAIDEILRDEINGVRLTPQIDNRLLTLLAEAN